MAPPIISAVRLHWVQIPLWELFRISNGEISVKDAVLIEIEADGKTGWGEASPLGAAAYSEETPESSWNCLHDQLVPTLLQQPQAELQARIEALAEDFHEPFAKAGLEGALWDLRAQLSGKPLWSLLGGSLRQIPSGVAIGLMDKLSDLLERVERFREQGYQRTKIKIAPGRDIELVRAIRQEFGDIPLMVDANAAYNLDDIKIFEELDAFGLMMIEQPLARHALEEHAELQSRLRTPICLDESAENLEAVRAIIRQRSGRIINIKVQRVGGLWPALQVHNLAQEAGIACWLGTMPELGIASMQGLHLATLPNFKLPSDVEASERWYVDDVIDPAITITRDGFIHLSEAPGMGCSVARDRVEKYRVRFEEFRP